ncbi:MAG TPA: hypothetical protein VLD67_02410 [Vicinamibacterales bacterium]|nr:hypothetical protein [Vicinamibacterales bacterium]
MSSGAQPQTSGRRARYPGAGAVITGRPSRPALVLWALLPLLAGGCGPSVDLREALEVTELAGGWYDQGVEDGRNKLVPSVTFRLRKTTDQRIRALALNVIFKRASDAEGNLDEVYLQKVEFDQHDMTASMTIRAKFGYTADPPQTRAMMLQNSQFEDARAVIFGKQSSANWVELARFDVPRQLLTK